MLHPRTLVVCALTIMAAWLAGCGGSSVSMQGVGPTPVVADYGDSMVVVPGPEYRAGWLHRIFFGDHYRDLWTDSLRVPTLDLATCAGGLTPLEAGGGFQTKSLQFQGADGRKYKFRSVDKDPTSVLPEDLRDTFAADLAQDHISTSHPAGSLVVDYLAGAVGVPQLHPRLMMLPDDPRLGAFRGKFGGILGVFEIYPDDGPNGTPGFLGSTNIENALKMFKAMEDNSEDRPDGVAFLTARLLDMFVGDWDRHVKQWKWARFERNNRKTWYPIPMDRDQAFARLDGLLPWIAAMAVPQFESFSDEFNDIFSLTYSGRYLDRRILAEIDKPTWDSVVTLFVSHLTDAVIDSAVDQLPPEFYRLDGARLSSALKSRRDSFRWATDVYYGQLASFVDVVLSDKREYVDIVRRPGDRVELTAYRRDKKSGDREGEPVFHRVFTGGETREIRLYLRGGDDKAVVSGDVTASIDVRIIGGKGDDELVDNSVVHGVLWGFVPFIAQADHKTYFYDSAGENVFVKGPGTSVNTSKE